MKPSFNFKLSFILFFSLGLASFLLAQIGRGRIHGLVQDEEGNLLKGAKIVGYNQRFDINFEVYADKKGHWAKGGLRGGRWKITASAEGYFPETIYLEVKQLSRNPVVEFRLKKIKIKTEMPFIQNESSVALFKEGNRLYEEKKYDEAIASFQQFLEKKPAVYQIHINIGNCYRDKGEYEKAIGEYNIVLEAVKRVKKDLKGDISAAKALANIGECYLKKGDMEAAHKYLKNSIDIYPEDENLAYNVAEIFFAHNRIEEALHYFHLASQINPRWADPYLKLGYAYLNQAKYREALKNFNKFLELAPDSPQAPNVRKIMATLEKMKEC